MSLAEFQRAFADLVAAPELCLAARRDPAGSFAPYDLTPREGRRLRRMVRDPGMSINCTLYRVNRLTPVYSVLPLTCRLLGDGLVALLDAFWRSPQEATIQYGREAMRFGLWLQERIAAGEHKGGPVEDALAFELAAFAVRTALPSEASEGSDHRTQWVHFKYEPDEVLNPGGSRAGRRTFGDDRWLLLDATTGDLKVYRLRSGDDSPLTEANVVAAALEA